MFFPVGVNYLIGKKNDNYLELGINYTTTLKYGSYNDADVTSVGGFGTLNFGYRYQPARKGFTFRTTINPIITRNVFWPFYGALSVGYKF